MMQWIASIRAPVIYIFEFGQTEQDISDPCVINVRQAQLNHCNTEAATPETWHQRNSWQFKWCNVLHRVTSNKFPPICLMCVMFSAPMVDVIFLPLPSSSSCCSILWVWCCCFCCCFVLFFGIDSGSHSERRFGGHKTVRPFFKLVSKSQICLHKLGPNVYNILNGYLNKSTIKLGVSNKMSEPKEWSKND